MKTPTLGLDAAFTAVCRKNGSSHNFSFNYESLDLVSHKLFLALSYTHLWGTYGRGLHVYQGRSNSNKEVASKVPSTIPDVCSTFEHVR
jgi:hypothetical protein